MLTIKRVIIINSSIGYKCIMYVLLIVTSFFSEATLSLTINPLFQLDIPLWKQLNSRCRVCVLLLRPIVKSGESPVGPGL